MKEVAISEFKAKCLSLLDQVQKTKKPIIVTRFGKPIAQVSPAPAETSAAGWFGSMKDRIEILGDIISPADIGRLRLLLNTRTPGSGVCRLLIGWGKKSHMKSGIQRTSERALAFSG
jgi:prevent-host-death family protein